MRTNKATEVFAAPNHSKNLVERINAGTPLHVVEAAGSLYKVQLPDEQEVYINSNVVSEATPSAKIITTDSAEVLLADANEMASRKN